MATRTTIKTCPRCTVECTHVIHHVHGAFGEVLGAYTRCTKCELASDLATIVVHLPEEISCT